MTMLLWVSAGLEKICILDSAQMPGGDRKKTGTLVMSDVSGSVDLGQISPDIHCQLDEKSILKVCI